MMRKMAYFLIFLTILACAEEPTPKITNCFMLQISAALPVKVYLSGETSFNNENHESDGIEKFCFNQEFECDDDIEFQLIDNTSEEIVSEFDTDFDEWFNTANGVTPSTGGDTANWVWSADLGGSLKVTTFNIYPTKGLRLSGVTLPQNPFQIRIRFSMPIGPRNSTNLSLRLIIRDSSNNQLLNQTFGGSSSGEDEVLLGVSNPSIWLNADHFWLETRSTNYVAGDVIHFSEISYLSQPNYVLAGYDEDDNELFSQDFDQSILLDGSTIVYSKSFTGSEINACDKKVRVEIKNNDTIVGFTEFIRISNNIAHNIKVLYKGTKPYAGLWYYYGSDYFMTRIPGRFFHPRKSGQTTSMELSSNKFITTSTLLQKKRLLEIEDAPEYFHDMIELILNHAAIGSVQINGVEWERAAGDDYVYNEDTPDEYPLIRAEVVLSRKDWIKRNVI